MLLGCPAGTAHVWHAQFLFLTSSLWLRLTQSHKATGTSQDIPVFPTIWCRVPSVVADPVPSAGLFIESNQVAKKTILEF